MKKILCLTAMILGLIVMSLSFEFKEILSCSFFFVGIILFVLSTVILFYRKNLEKQQKNKLFDMLRKGKIIIKNINGKDLENFIFPEKSLLKRGLEKEISENIKSWKFHFEIFSLLIDGREKPLSILRAFNSISEEKGQNEPDIKTHAFEKVHEVLLHFMETLKASFPPKKIFYLFKKGEEKPIIIMIEKTTDMSKNMIYVIHEMDLTFGTYPYLEIGDQFAIKINKKVKEKERIYSKF